MIILGSDHGGLQLKDFLKENLLQLGMDVKDMGVFQDQAVDYPDIAKITCQEYLKGQYQFGILVCGTGIGISMVANRFKGIRCALLSDAFSAQMAKEHNNANMVAFGGRTITCNVAWSLLNLYMNAKFLGGRHQNRVDKIDECLECKSHE